MPKSKILIVTTFLVLVAQATPDISYAKKQIQIKKVTVNGKTIKKVIKKPIKKKITIKKVILKMSNPTKKTVKAIRRDTDICYPLYGSKNYPTAPAPRTTYQRTARHTEPYYYPLYGSSNYKEVPIVEEKSVSVIPVSYAKEVPTPVSPPITEVKPQETLPVTGIPVAGYIGLPFLVLVYRYWKSTKKHLKKSLYLPGGD